MKNNDINIVRLLSVALSPSQECTIEGDIDADSLVHLAYHQEVSAFVYDAVNKLHEKGYDVIQDKNAKFRLLTHTLKQEKQFPSNLKTIKKISDFFDNNNVIMYVLKGLSIAQNYSKPEHRYSCDLDCILASKSSESFESVFEEGNALLENNGIKVSNDYYKHSEFRVNGLYVENHKFCCSVKRGRRTKELERYLQSLLTSSSAVKSETYGLYFPQLMFQAIFMIEHSNSHFLYEKINLKHICDWAMFREANNELLDWQEFQIQCERFGLWKFVEAMNGLADFVMGKKEYYELNKWERRIFDDSMHIVTYVDSKMVRRVRKAFGILRSGWKFRYFGHSSMIKELFTAFFAYLFEEEPKLTE